MHCLKLVGSTEEICNFKNEKQTMETITDFFNFELFSFNDNSLSVFDLFSIILIIVITKLILWIISKALFNKKKLHKLDEGSSFALFQIIKYLIWIIAITLMLETLGIKVTILLAGSAALLVGVGLGLQQTFNDMLSGIILLFEHSVKVGDILEIDGDRVIIQEIGLRTSKGMNVRQIVVIIPNSLITTNKVINWSHQTQKTLFSINIGVAYSSDVDLVIKTLEKSAIEHLEFSECEFKEVRFVDFGNSSMDFQLFFYSKNIFTIEKVKSDIRKIIFRKFNEQKITIPFPQMDLHVKSKDI
jgi:small-conductance mechanosensitive channel